MSNLGLEVYSRDHCARLEQTICRRERAAHAEYRRLSATRRIAHRQRLASWIGMRLVAVGAWLCATSGADTHAHLCVVSTAEVPER